MKRKIQSYNFDIDEESGELIPEAPPALAKHSVGCSDTDFDHDNSGCWMATDRHRSRCRPQLLRLVLLALTPIQIFFTLFFGQVIVGCLAQIFGPVRQMTVNSMFYSARPPPRIQSAKSFLTSLFNVRSTRKV